MKGKKSNAGKKLLNLLAFPLALLFLLGVVIALPFDYIRYKMTRYYKDTHEKYSLFCAVSSYIKLYALIKKNALPIEYYRCDAVSMTGYGYFIYKDILILGDYDNLCFDTEKNTWTVSIQDEYVDIIDDVKATIEKCNDFLQDEVCKKAVVLIDSDDYNKHPDLKYECFDFCPVHDGDLASALKRIIK